MQAADGRTDGQTDMTKLIIAFHHFANKPKNGHNADKGNDCRLSAFFGFQQAMINKYFLNTSHVCKYYCFYLV